MASTRQTMCKTAIVTGGSRGIGKAIVRALSDNGIDVVINYISDIQAAEKLASELKSLGRRVLTVQADVADEEQVDELVKRTISEFGRTDILVNNAGILPSEGPVLKIEKEEWDRVIAVNLNGVFICSKAILKPMMQQRFGKIINISSMAAHTGDSAAHYVASKAGVIGLTRALAREAAPYNINVNAISPGFILTDLFELLPHNLKEAKRKQVPVRRIGTPEDVAGAVLYLISESAGYITGANLNINGGTVMR